MKGWIALAFIVAEAILRIIVWKDDK